MRFQFSAYNDLISNAHDICLIRVAAAFEFNDGVDKLDIDDAGSCLVDSKCSISGWGATVVSILVKEYACV